MNSSAPLQALLGYRIRRRRATDGVAYRTRSGQHYAGESVYGGAAGNLGNPSTDDAYDPVDMRYPTRSQYDPPRPWEPTELHPRTPMLRFESPELPEPPPHPVAYDDGVVTQAEFEIVLRDTLDRNNQRFADEHQPDPVSIEQAPRFREESSPHEPDSISPDLPLEARAITSIAPMRDAADFLGSTQVNALETPLSDIEMPERVNAMVDSHGFAAGAPGEVMVPAPTLDIIVDQLGGGSNQSPPEVPDTYLLMNQRYNRPMHLMEPFNPMGPMGM